MDYCLHCMTKTTGNFCSNCGKRPHEVSSSEYHLKAGTVLNGKYLVGASIGEGGFGITYIGMDTTLEIKVAIKEYFPSGYANRGSDSGTVSCGTAEERKDFYINGRDRFLKEARALAKFSGEPGIVNVRDFFEENNTAYIVMEYVDGKTLKDLIKRFGTLSAEKTKELITPIMLSLIKIHKEGIIHRDISPSNIMITYDKQAKLLDFGAARAVTGDGNKSLSVLLKPGYAPEEQYRSRGNQGEWTDVYSLCATMYKCITGITPDEAPERVYNDQLKSPSVLGVKIDPAFETALMKGLSVLQKDRYQSVDELMKGMEEIGEAEQEMEKNQAGEKTQSIFEEAQEIDKTAPTPIPTPTPAPSVQQPAYTAQKIPQSNTFNNNVYWEAVPHKAENPTPSPINYQSDIPTSADDKTQYVFAEAQNGGQANLQNGAPFTSAQQNPPLYAAKAKKEANPMVVFVTIMVMIILISVIMYLRFKFPLLLVNKDATHTTPPVTSSATEALTTTNETTNANSSSSDNVSFKHGYVQNGTWKNETLGICADFGSEWSIYNDEALADYNEISEITDETIQSALSTKGYFNDAVFDNIDPSTGIVTTEIIIGVEEDLKVMTNEAFREKEYANETSTAFEEELKSLGYSIDISTLISSVNFAGSDHSTAFIQYTANDQTVYQQSIFIKFEKYMGYVIIASVSVNELKSATEMFYALQ